jgi:hypothetical protein
MKIQESSNPRRPLTRGKETLPGLILLGIIFLAFLSGCVKEKNQEEIKVEEELTQKMKVPFMETKESDEITIAGLKWNQNSTKALEIARSKNKSIFVYVTPLEFQEEFSSNYNNPDYEYSGDYSFRFQKWLLEDRELSGILNKSFVLLVVDFNPEKEEPEKSFKVFEGESFRGGYPQFYVFTPSGILSWKMPGMPVSEDMKKQFISTLNSSTLKTRIIMKNITEEEAIDIALERYPGKIISVNKTYSEIPGPNRTVLASGDFWVIIIELDNPIEEGDRIVKKVEIKIDARGKIRETFIIFEHK